MADRVKPDDELFVVGYPYFNVNGSFQTSCVLVDMYSMTMKLMSAIYYAEMIVVEELYKEAVMNTTRKLIIFNGEIDRIRSGCILGQSYISLGNFEYSIQFNQHSYLNHLDLK